MAAPSLASVFLILLYSWQCYSIGFQDIYIQAGLAALVTILMETLWNNESGHPAINVCSRKSIRAGWYCTTLLPPILILAYGGPHMEQLHLLSVVASLTQAALCSYQNVPLFGAVGASLGFLVSQAIKTIAPPVLAKSAISAVSLQVALLIGMKQTFSVGEAAFLAQLVVLLKYLWSAAEWTILQKASYATLIGTTMAVVAVSSIAQVLNFARNPLVLPTVTLGSIYGVSHIFRIDPIELKTKLMELFVSEGAQTVFIFWIVGMIVIALTTSMFLSQDISKEDTAMLQIFRKSYHLIALLLFMPSGLYNLELLQSGLAVSATIFIFIEASRVIMRDTTVGTWLDEFIEQFSTEEEGEGTAILPHFFLLFGCAIPVMLSDVFNSIHAYAGIFALCITDASAAIAGSLIGEHKWPSSKKTVEGTLIAMLVSYVFMSFVSELIAFEQAVPDLPAILAFSACLPIWEALSDQNDNLTLPIVAYAISRLVF